MKRWPRVLDPERRHSLLARAAVGNFVLQTLAAAAVSAVLLLSVSRAIQDQMELRAKSLASFLAAQSRFELLIGDRQGLEELARSAMQDQDALFVTIGDSAGEIRIQAAAQGFDAARIEGRVSQTPVVRERPVRYVEVDRLVAQPATHSLFGLEQEAASGAPLGVVRVGLSLARYDKMRAGAAVTVWLAAFLCIGAVTGVQYLNLRRLLKPLRELIAFTRTVSEGDLSKEAPVRRRDEAGDLAIAFNEMIKGLRSRQELTLRMREVEASQRLRNEFLANMSHEIRTPMNGIIGLTELVLQTELNEEQRDYLTTVRTSAGSLLTVLNDILDFSKVDAGKLELRPAAFDLWETVCQAGRTLSVAAHDNGLEIVCDVAREIPAILVGDATRLRQVLLNLMGNAVKFSRQGQIVVKVDPEGCADNVVTLRFTVSDTGIGIPEDRLQHIFEPFTQVDSSATRNYGGTGLGLAISSQLVKLLGGEIGVTSRVGQGSTFDFTARFEILPGQPAPQAPPELAAVHALLVDDNAETRRVAAKLLRRWGMEVAEFASVEAAERALASDANGGRRSSIALVDHDLLAGLEHASGAGGQPGLIDVFAAGPGLTLKPAAQHAVKLQKPVEPHELQRALRTALAAQDGRGAGSNTAAPGAPPPEPVSSLRILLAEDNLVNQKLAKRLLEKRGHSVTTALNGREALDAMAGGRFDLVLMDVQMPEMDGLQATVEIRRRDRRSGGHTPVLIVTAHALSGFREQCLEAGADGYISKPIDARELDAAIRQAVETARVP
jgi:signal transduction histidine kinase/CheY-like chemotaxis protein